MTALVAGYVTLRGEALAKLARQISRERELNDGQKKHEQRPRVARPRLSDWEYAARRTEIRAMRREGRSAREIAAALGVGARQAQRLARSYPKGGV